MICARSASSWLSRLDCSCFFRRDMVHVLFFMYSQEDRVYSCLDIRRTAHIKTRRMFRRGDRSVKFIRACTFYHEFLQTDTIYVGYPLPSRSHYSYSMRQRVLTAIPRSVAGLLAAGVPAPSKPSIVSTAVRCHQGQKSQKTKKVS